MKIKFLCAVAAIAVGFAAEAAYADAPAPTPDFTITGDAALVSSYRFRGIAQTDNKPTGQGAITVTHSSGFYVSTWFSGNTFNGGSEIDVYGGYSKTLKDGITLDGGLYGYLYPNAPTGESYELYADASKSFGPVGTKIGVNWAPKQAYFTTFNTATHYDMYEYAELTYSPAALSALTVHGHLGHTGGGFDFPKQYIDYVAGVSYKVKSLTFDISATGTNLSHADVAGYADHRLVKSVAVASVTANF
jgi:uncharacterized protein (TIGR02001 family)